MRATHASIGHRLKLDPKVTADQRGHGVGIAIEEYTKTPVKERAAAAKKLEQEALGKRGSARESDRGRILGCFLEDHEFGSGRCHPLCLEQEVTEVFVATPPTQ